MVPLTSVAEVSRGRPRGLSQRERALKAHLEVFGAARKTDALAADPIRFARRYDEPSDREVVALLAALFAYGNVKVIGAFLEALFSRLGPSPALTLRAGELPRELPGHRFQTPGDVRGILRAVGTLLRRAESLEAAFALLPGDPDQRLEAFALALRAAAGRATPGLLHLLPLPSTGSACKRWHLFLRWVVRPDDGVDLGLWRCLSSRDLLVPVDTHVARVARALGLTGRTTPDGAFCREVTAALRRFDSEDPVRYDFALAHLGILKACPSHRDASLCAACGLRPHCRHGNAAIRDQRP